MFVCECVCGGLRKLLSATFCACPKCGLIEYIHCEFQNFQRMLQGSASKELPYSERFRISNISCSILFRNCYRASCGCVCEGVFVSVYTGRYQCLILLCLPHCRLPAYISKQIAPGYVRNSLGRPSSSSALISILCRCSSIFRNIIQQDILEIF